MGFAGRKAVVSGGSSGIGLAAAKRLAREGANVVILARDPERLQAAQAEIEAVAASGVKVGSISVDVAEDAAVAALPAKIEALIGVCDLLIANQGYARCDPALDMPLAQFRALMETNFFGHVKLVQALAPGMKAAGGGDICLVTSMLGFMSFYGYGAYAASKFAIVGFAEALRQEMLPHGVGVSVFYPPTTDTPGLAAENETKPELTWAIEGTSRKFSSDAVADTLLAGVSAGRFTNMIGLDSWAIYKATRWGPGVVRWVLDRSVWRHVRKHGGAL